MPATSDGQPSAPDGPIVKSIVVRPANRSASEYIPNFLSAETATFNVTFDRPMNTSAVPALTIGQPLPFSDVTARSIGWTDTQNWSAALDITSAFPNGEYGVRIENATDTSGSIMAPDYSGRLWIDTARPTLSAVLLWGYWQGPGPVFVDILAEDGLVNGSAGLWYLDTFYKWSTDNVTWNDWRLDSRMPLNGSNFTGTVSINLLPKPRASYQLRYVVVDRSLNLVWNGLPLILGSDGVETKEVGRLDGRFWWNSSTVPVSMQITGFGLTRAGYAWFNNTDNATMKQNHSHQAELSIAPTGGTYVTDIPAESEGWYGLLWNWVSGHVGTVIGGGPGTVGGVDWTPPSSRIATDDLLVNTTTVQVLYESSDNLSGIASVSLEGRRVPAADWISIEAANSSSGALSVSSSKLGGDGAYILRLIARDQAGNSDCCHQRSYLNVTFDTKPPEIATASPGNGASNVPTAVRPTLEFSEPVWGSVELRQGHEVVTSDLIWESGQTGVTIVPRGPLSHESDYSIHIRVQDSALNWLAAEVPFRIGPPFWKLPAFGIALALVLLALAVACISVLLRRGRRERRSQEITPASDRLPRRRSPRKPQHGRPRTAITRGSAGGKAGVGLAGLPGRPRRKT